MRADRLISLLMLLQTKGQMTAQELAQRLEVSVRTVYRDLEALSFSGVPVYTERGPNGGCALLESYRTNLTGLKEAEVRALFLFTVPGLLADLGADAASEAALLKLTAALPAPFRRSAEIVRQRFYFDSAAWFQLEEPTPCLATIQEAILTQQRLRFLYQSANGGRSRSLVEPYGLVAKAGVWYLVGSTYGVTVFRVARIQNAETTGAHFEYPSDFDLGAFWRDWSARVEADLKSYPVTLRVAHEGIPLLVHTFGEGVRQLFPEVKRVDPTEWADPPQWITVTLKFESAEAACRQILGLGIQVTIVEPGDLAKKVAEMARRLAAHHEETGK